MANKIISAVWAVFGLLIVLTSPADASANCGMVNGSWTCSPDWGHCATGPKGTVCEQRPSCDYANGKYKCILADAKAPKTPAMEKPKAENSGVVVGLEWLSGWFAGDGIDTWWEAASKKLVEKAVVAYLDAKINSVKFAWSIAKGVLESFNVFSNIAGAFSALPANVHSMLSFFNVFAAIGNILTAGMTRFVMKLVPGL